MNGRRKLALFRLPGLGVSPQFWKGRPLMTEMNPLCHGMIEDTAVRNLSPVIQRSYVIGGAGTRVKLAEQAEQQGTAEGAER